MFIVAAKGDRIAIALMADAAGQAAFFVGGHTLAEFHRGGRTSAREAQLFDRWRPEVLSIGASEGRLAGVLLAATHGENSMDALVVATAELHGIAEIFTTDPADLERLRDARAAGSRPIAVVAASDAR